MVIDFDNTIDFLSKERLEDTTFCHTMIMVMDLEAMNDIVSGDTISETIVLVE